MSYIKNLDSACSEKLNTIAKVPASSGTSSE
jgi:hypothetical protein